MLSIHEVIFIVLNFYVYQDSATSSSGGESELIHEEIEESEKPILPCLIMELVLLDALLLPILYPLTLLHVL